MAFGFGFNKQKVLSAAEKFVQQGKLQNAIAEYEKIRKHDNKDLTVANTIGDLYARLGDSTKAIECFKAVGDAYAAQGFTVKGIAMYKKITKLQPSVDGSLKLAELYTQQGLFNDARAQYLQVAEEFMKNGELEQAVRLFQKVLEMDPENVPMRVKLAEVYIKLDKKKDAWEIFSAAAESLRARGSLAAAEDILQRMLALDPGNSYVLLMRGRAALDSDDPRSAIQYLEKAADIDTHPEGLRDLLKAYLEIGELAKSTPLAEKLLTVHNDAEGMFLLGEGAARLGHYDRALEIYSKHAERLLATDSTKLLANLHALIAHVQGDVGALEELLELLKKSGDNTHINEVSELLAHASVKDGNLERARDLYQMLATSEPQNTLHAQNYQQVRERLEGPAKPAIAGISAEEGALIVEELEATAPVLDQLYPDAVAIAVRTAVTDADLFLSYNLPDKALVPLLGALPEAPRDVRLNQRLASLHTRFQRFAEAAVCCRTLESVYHEAGHSDEALRYGELAARYEQNASAALVSTSLASASAASNVAPETAMAEAHLREPEAHPEFSVGHAAADAPTDEVHDASAEWEHALAIDESTLVEETPVRSTGSMGRSVGDVEAEIAETADEIRFYAEHFMNDQALAAFEKLKSLTHDPSILDALRKVMEASSEPAEEADVEIADINADDPEAFEIELPSASTDAVAKSSDLLAGHDPVRHDMPGVGAQEQEATPEPVMQVNPQVDQEPSVSEETSASTDAVPVQFEAEPNELSSLVADLERSLTDGFFGSPAETEPEAEHSTQALPGWPGALPGKRAAEQAPQLESDPAAEPTAKPAPSFATAAGSAAAAATPALSYSAAAVRPLGEEAQAKHPAGNVDLSEMFGELKQQLEDETPVSEEDPETHYNLGVAFREMGLLDEAIAELQKVCTAIDHGHAFSQAVQTYTWLAQCFLDKGVPEAAIHWYEKALKIPGLDAHARVAINYELGSACESAQDKTGALRHFTYVYGANIDYRDVAERIQALKS